MVSEQDHCVLEETYIPSTNWYLAVFKKKKRHQTVVQQCRNRRYAMLPGKRQNIENKAFSPR
jgi:hypothetical protein